MDLIYTCHTSATKRRRRRNAAIANDGLGLPPSSPTAASICCVSPRNVLLFTTSSQSHLPKGASSQESSSSVHEFGVENGGSGGGNSASAAKHSVFVCDLNTPWEVRSWSREAMSKIHRRPRSSPATKARIMQPWASFIATKCDCRLIRGDFFILLIMHLT